jgi:hypothetical protein
MKHSLAFEFGPNAAIHLYNKEQMMPRPAKRTSIDDIVRDAMDGVVKRASVAIAGAIAEMAARQLDEELQNGVARVRTGRKAGRGLGGGVRAAGRRGRPRRARTEITRWAADRRARRVPNFVIDLTGLKTKKQIVAKYGAGVVFEKGKAAPSKAK